MTPESRALVAQAIKSLLGASKVAEDNGRVLVARKPDEMYFSFSGFNWLSSYNGSNKFFGTRRGHGADGVTKEKKVHIKSPFVSL